MLYSLTAQATPNQLSSVLCRIALTLLAFSFAFAPPPLCLASEAPLIGRLNYAGYKRKLHCSGFLTSAGHFITARHCVDVPQSAQLHFLEGYERGAWALQFDFSATSFFFDGKRDLAFVCDATVSSSQRISIADEPPQIGEAVEVWGYASPRNEVLQRIPCSVKDLRTNHLLVLDCKVAAGQSGGPVLRSRGHRFHALGVVSAHTRFGSLAELLRPEQFSRLCNDVRGKQ